MIKGNIILNILLIILLIGFSSAYETHKQNTTYSYSETVANADSCNITSIKYPDGTLSVLNIQLDKDGFEFSKNISNNNFTQTGDTCWGIVCYDSDADPQYISGNKCLDVTQSGLRQDVPSAMANIMIILFLMSLMAGLYFLNSRINYEKWYSSIINKYENKNYIKLVLASIGYNIMKNSFILYYLLGLPILLSLMDIVYSFNVESMVNIIKVFIGIYIIGSIILGVYFLGFVQEWIMKLLDDISNIKWGLGND